MVSRTVRSDTSRPHGLQPTKLLCPWDFPGKSTGMGCYALLQGIFLTQGPNLSLLSLLHWLADSLPLRHLRSSIMRLNEFALLCCAQSLQSCPTLCSPTDCSPPGSSAHRILQARTLEWVAVPFPRGSSWPRDWSRAFCSSCIAGRFFTTEPPRKPKWVNPYVKVLGCCLPTDHTASPI